MAIGEAYVNVHADTRPFAKEVGKQLREILKKAQHDVDADGVKLGESIANSAAKGAKAKGRKIGENLGDETEKGLRARLRGVTNAFSDAFNRMSRGNFRPLRVIGNLFLRLGQVIGKSFEIVKNFGGVLVAFAKYLFVLGESAFELIKGLIRGGSDLSKIGASVAASFADLIGAVGLFAAEAPIALATIAAMAAGFVVLSIAIYAVVAAIIVVASVFADLLGFLVLIPAALSAVLAIVLPLVIAMHDLGDALQLVLEKDPDKLAKGLKKLSPTLRGLVGVLREFRKSFEGIRDAVQQAFFGPIIKQLGPTLKALLPVIKFGFTQVAGTVGMFVADLLRLARSPEMINFFRTVLPGAAQTLQTLSGPILAVIGAFANAATTLMPSLNNLVASFGTFIEDFANWVNQAVADGRFQKFLTNAVLSLESIWNLVKELIGLFGDMFSQTNAGGREFLKTVTAAIKQFRDWVNSPEGKRAMQDMVFLAQLVAVAFRGALDLIQKIMTITSVILSFWRKIARLMGKKPAESSGGLEGILGRVAGNVAGYASGGIISQDQLAQLHANEVVIPLTNQGRAMELAQQSGLMDMLAPQTSVAVYIGDERLDARIDYRVATNNKVQARTLSNGPRR
jgi:hypothetical protein